MFKYLHCFIAGIFIAAAISQSILFAIILAIILIIFWGNYALPLFMALLIDTSFVDARELQNLFGFAFTIVAGFLTVLLMPLRKFLKF
jgi:hypothetical protein